MKVHTSLDTWKQTLSAIKSQSDRPQSIGFVPTMGALHGGHASLIERARRENDVVLVSIFVNPTQFEEAKSFVVYPRSFEEDQILAEKAGCDHLIYPTPALMYPDDYRYRVTEQSVSKVMEGAHRPGHFDGVLTVVLKLFNIAGATRAYFGEKDFQQLELVRGMKDAFFIETDIIPCATLREVDGLAMSSRNRLLSTEERKKAPEFYAALKSAKSPSEARNILFSSGFEVDYVEDRNDRRFGAVKLGTVRLIDNIPLSETKGASR